MGIKLDGPKIAVAKVLMDLNLALQRQTAKPPIPRQNL
jgi:hypothetical protein